MIAQSVGEMEIVVVMSSLAGGLVLDKSELVQGSELPIKCLFASTPITGGRGGITQGVSFEFFESFLLIYSHNTH